MLVMTEEGFSLVCLLHGNNSGDQEGRVEEGYSIKTEVEWGRDEEGRGLEGCISSGVVLVLNGRAKGKHRHEGLWL